jgi:hypothetical protein
VPDNTKTISFELYDMWGNCIDSGLVETNNMNDLDEPEGCELHILEVH